MWCFDCHADAAKNPAATPVGDDGGDLKAIGKKKMTNIDIATLEPVWNKKFVLALPPKAVLKAISTSRSSRLDANDISSLTEEEHFAAVSACDYTLIVDVLDADRFSKEVFLGHVVLPVHSLPLRDALTKWHPLTRRGPKDKVFACTAFS
jgi:C2 domain